MGCDIHLLVERRIERAPLPPQWIAVRIIRNCHTAKPVEYGMNFAFAAALERNYGRFAALAGVRGDGPPARGLPADASDTARLLFLLDGDHTPSWLPLAEAAEIFVATERFQLRDVDAQYSASHYFHIEPEADGPIEDHRIVFWFDS